MVRPLCLALFLSCWIFHAAQAQTVSSQAQQVTRPHIPPHHKPTWGGGQGSTPNNNGYSPSIYPIYPYDYGASGMMGGYPPQYPQQDPGSHVTINGKTFPPRNQTQQGQHSSVQVDGH